jgi:Leucine-rich repeat (LRR) protein
MPNLKVLHLDRTPLLEIPPGICAMTQLVHLDLWDSSVEYLPADFKCLKNLKVIDLRRTYLAEFNRPDLEKRTLPGVEIQLTEVCKCQH